jgi:poly-beta-1,6-N-acetyl-D-glucosamine synthase
MTCNATRPHDVCEQQRCRTVLLMLAALSLRSLAIVLLYVLSFLLIWQFVGYPLLMGIIALRQKPKDKDYSDQPFVSILVPTYNEGASIEKRIHNLYSLNYAVQNFEIIVVDSGSTDSTARCVKRLIEESSGERRPLLSLVREERRNGKGAAINLGKRHARGDIILVTDANAVFNNDALMEIVTHFKDPHVGAVGGKYSVLNPGTALTSSTKFYRDLEHVLRTGEAAACSACLFDGEINAWRKNVMDIDPTMIAEDLDMCIKLRKMGYKIDYEPKAIVYEAVPTTLREQIKQRRRTSVGTITSILNNLGYVAVPKDIYRLIILPSHKMLAMLSPFMLLTIPALYIATLNWGTTLFHLTAFIIVFTVFFALLARVRVMMGGTYKTERFSTRTVFGILFYVLLTEFIVLAAWKDVALGNYSVRWEMAKTTRRGGIL